MDSKHIERDFSAHRKSVIRPYDEYVKLEIFSFDPKFTKIYLAENNTLKPQSNAVKTNWKSWSCYCSENKTDDMVFDLSYITGESGDYRIDLIYEQSNHIYDKKDYNTGKDLSGSFSLDGIESSIKFDGENNIIKRIPLYKSMTEGTHTIRVEVPHNCYFMGVIIRKIKLLVGDNYYGASLGSEEGDLVLTSATVTISDKTKPSELSCEIFYDPSLVCEDNASGFYIDYHDEVNFYVKNDNAEVERVFGGYVSSILPDSNLTKLTISCADRLNDGVNKYVLDQLTFQGGTEKQSEDDYTDGMTKDFTSYPQALKYLCDIHEITLKSNITKNYTVDGEKFHDGVIITFGKNKTVKKIKTSNAESTPSKNYIMLRNKSSGEKKQVWTLYNAKDHTKTPPEISDYGYMHITYGLGNPKTEHKSKVTEKVDTADTTAGSQKFGKCGVSSDKKYVMAIGTVSSAKDKGHYGTYYKTTFKNKCPHCGSASLRWDSCRSDTKCIYTQNWNGSKGTWGVSPVETEITCTSCDSDYSALGNEKDSPWKKLTKVSSTVKSSKAEQTKLHQGKMVAVPKSGVTLTPDDIFKAITKLAFKYKYKQGSNGQTFTEIQKSGHGDCWGFSDLIFKQLKKYNVSCKIVEYKTNYANNHRSVMYKNNKGKWTDFPYREYGWNTKYNNMLNNTSGSKNGRMVEQNNGVTIGSANASKSTTKSQTTTITTTKGYDKDKPFQAYLKITYSLSPSFNAKKYDVSIKFTQNAPTSTSINTGLPLYWINNTTKKVTLQLENNKSLIDFLRTKHGENARIYLQTIQFITPVKKATKNDKETDWYKVDNSTKDYSSCKMNLYQITFDDNASTNSKKLQSCGKTVNNMLSELVKDAGYRVDMTYGLHRKDDKINFSIVNQTTESFTAHEGDSNNILKWGSITYSPLNSMRNMSMQVFKNVTDGMYYYVDTRDANSIMMYGEQCTLETVNDPISDKEAYFNAMNNEKYNPDQTYTFTITVPNCPLLKLGDLVKVVANAKKLSSLKEVSSLKITFKKDQIPRVQTEIGLGELAPDIQLKQNIRKLRQDSRKDSTAFYGSAIPINKLDVYMWDK